MKIEDGAVMIGLAGGGLHLLPLFTPHFHHCSLLGVSSERLTIQKNSILIEYTYEIKKMSDKFCFF